MAAGSTVLLVIVAIFFPPAAALFITGCSCDLLINVFLTILGYIPGHVHAFWLIYKRARAAEMYGPRGYRYVGNGEFRGVRGAPVSTQPYAAQPVVPKPYYGATTSH